MKIYSTYSVKIKHYNSIFKNTISVYIHAVDYLITVCLNEWKTISLIDGSLLRQQFVERLCHSTKDNPSPYPDFDISVISWFSHFPSSAITIFYINCGCLTSL